MSYNPPSQSLNLPSGSILAFAGPHGAPEGWLWCLGQTVKRTDYPDLFLAIRETYGGGDGNTTFILPDLRVRAIIGAGTGSGLTSRNTGDVGGEETHKLSVEELPSHHHLAHNQGQYPVYGLIGTGWDKGYGRTQTSIGGYTGSDQPHNNMMPYIVLPGYIIKT